MNWKRYLSIIGILILVYLIYRIGFSKILNVVLNVNLFYIIIAFIFSFMVIIPPVFKWSIILKKQGIKIKFYELFKIDLIGMFYGVITPGRVGTFLRIFYLKDKIKKPLGFCSSSVVLDKLLDLMAIAVFATFGALLLLNKLNVFIPALIFLLFLVFGLVYFSNKKRSRFLLKLFYNYFIPKKFKKTARESFHSFYKTMPKLKDLLIPFLIALVSYLLFYSLNYIVALAFSINIPFIYLITLSALATIVSFLPITIAGLGTREATLVGLFSLFNVFPEKIVAMSLVAFLISTLSVALLGGYYSFKNG